MPDQKHELEQKLLADPFDSSTRRRYADLLQSQECWALAADQWRVLLKQGAGAEIHLELAYALLRLEHRDESQQQLALAEESPDHDERHPRYRELLGQTGGKTPALPNVLKLVPGGRAGTSSWC